LNFIHLCPFADKEKTFSDNTDKVDKESGGIGMAWWIWSMLSAFCLVSSGYLRGMDFPLV